MAALFSAATAILASAPSAASRGTQSMFAAAGRDAAAIEQLTWVMIGGAAIIFVVVMVLVAVAVRRPPRWLGRRSTIVVAGFAIPAVVLSALLVYGIVIERQLTSPRTKPGLAIEVIGEQFWWRVHYRDAARASISSANEIRIPVGVPVAIELRTRDVIHSFWVPSLAGKLDMIPGRTNRLHLEATRPGVFRGQCAEFCGPQHARMAFYVVAMPANDFRDWMQNERGPGAEPRTAAHQRGRASFIANCAGCHTVRGTAAQGVVGPDLTHFGSRHSVGAGLYPNNIGTTAGWIASSQHLKQGNRMPSFRRFSGEELLDLATYLESLR
jgi:cytochrome c oxidase subunit II